MFLFPISNNSVNYSCMYYQIFLLMMHCFVGVYIQFVAFAGCFQYRATVEWLSKLSNFKYVVLFAYRVFTSSPAFNEVCGHDGSCLLSMLNFNVLVYGWCIIFSFHCCTTAFGTFYLIWKIFMSCIVISLVEFFYNKDLLLLTKYFVCLGARKMWGGWV